MYTFSKGLDNIIQLCKPLIGFWSYRYHKIVDYSDKGQDCPYAHQAARYANEQQEPDKIRAQLLAIRAQVDMLLEEVDNEDCDNSE